MSASFIAALCLNAGQANANPGLPLLREQQRESQAFERQQRLRRLSPALIGSPTENPAPVSDSKHCWPISGVRLAGNTLIDSETLNSSLEALLQPCMSEAQINRVLKAITRLYVERGYLASRPYLANPLNADAPLDIMIVEGFVESVEFDDVQLPLSLSRAFPDLVGQPLTLMALEQGLAQMNRLQSFELSADLEPGDLQGGTRVMIRSKRLRTSRLLGLSDVNNFGSYTTGRGQTALALRMDSPLQQNDFAQVLSMSNLPGGPGEVRGHGLRYSIPHGPWMFSLSADRLRYQVPLFNSRYVSHGRTEVSSMTLERAIWHYQTIALGSSVRLSRKHMDSRFSGSRISLQSSTHTVLDADINLSWRNQSLWHATLGYSQGLPLFGANTQTITSDAPRPQFRKYRATLWHLHESLDPELRWRWVSELNLQYSPDPLHPLEQIAVGDGSAVRGFRDSGVSAASGAVWRNTLSLPLNTGLPLEIRPSLGLDAGWSRFDHGAPSQRLLGMSVGLELSRPDAQLRLDYQRPLHNDSTPRHALEPGHWRAQMTLVF